MASYSYTVGSVTDLNLNIFDFLIQPIRDKDKNEGGDFLRRFLEGPQAEWERTLATIEAIKNLWSITDCPDEFLQYLKRIVGWTPDLDHITEDLDYDALRRLIAISVPLWKNRTTENSIIDILNVLVPARARVWNWFQLRWVLDVAYLGLEEWQGRDPWLFDIDGPYWMNVRIVDNPQGAVDRDLIKGVLNLMRPCGERFQIVYLRFLDQFEQDGDLTQWTPFGDTPTIPATVEGGMLKQMDTSVLTGLYADVEDFADWGSTGGLMITFRVRTQTTATFAGPGMSWYLDPDALDGYYVQLCVDLNYLFVGQFSGGLPSSIADTDLDPFLTLELDRWYSVRVECVWDGTTNRIKIFIDGQLIVECTDDTYTQGGVGLLHTENSDLECDEIEVMPLPAETDTVEIND